MKKTFLAIAVVLLSAAWALAQTSAGTSGQSSSQTLPQNPGASSQSPSTTSPSSAGQTGSQTTPSNAGQAGASGSSTGASGNASGNSAADGPVTEGCLGGKDPNFTVTDQAGTVYNIAIPQGVNTSAIAQHIGESVQVVGPIDNGGNAPGGASSASPAGSGSNAASGSAASAGSGASSGSPTSATSGQRTIHATKMARGTTNCAGSSASPRK